MTMTMDDDGAILVHLTNPGGIVGGSGVANQITYWTNTDTIGGDAGLTYDAATDRLTIAGGITLSGATTVNILEVPDNIADAVSIEDGGALEYLRVISTDTNPYLCLFPSGGGNVGIGTTAPEVGLHLSGIGDASRFRITDSSADAGGAEIMLYHDRAGAIVQDDDIAGNVLARGWDGGAWRNLAQFNFEVDGVPGVNDMPGRMVFWVSPGGGAAFRRHLTLQADGTSVFWGNIVMANGATIGQPLGLLIAFDDTNNYLEITGGDVGIGTTAPEGTLHVVKSSNSPAIILENTGGTPSKYKFQAYSGQLEIYDVADARQSLLIQSDGDWQIMNGKVGIGTAAPLAQLHVDQSSASGGLPALQLDQADLSEEFIELTTTVGAGNPIDTAAIGSYYGRMRVSVTGVGYKYIALYNS